MKQTLEFPLAPFTLSITVISERNVSNKTELLLTALRFSFKFFGKISCCQFIIPCLAGSTPPYDAPHSISENSDVADPNKAIPKMLIIFIQKSSRYRQFEGQKKNPISRKKKKAPKSKTATDDVAIALLDFHFLARV